MSSAGGETVTLESYDDQDYGYLRVVASAAQLRIEYHPASDGAAAKTPDDFVTVDLQSRRLVHSTTSSGHAAAEPAPGRPGHAHEHHRSTGH